MISDVVQNKWLANGNQNAILNNVEEYYKYLLHPTGVLVPQIQKKIREAWTLSLTSYHI